MMLIFAAAMALLAPDAWLAMPMPEGFVTAHQQTAQSGAIEERIARGETVDKWTRMITLMRINADVPVATYLSNFMGTVTRACPGAKAGPQMTVRLGSHSFTEGRLDCPRNPSTGKPETFFYRATNADGAIQMVQVAFRRVPSAIDETWARAQLAGAVLCTTASADPLCQR